MSAGHRTIPRRLAAVCTGGFLALCASLYAAPVQAQEVETLISNFGDRAGVIPSNRETSYAQSFETGSNGAYYALHSVVMGVSNLFTQSFTVQVRESSGNNPSSTVVADLEARSIGSSAGDINVEFTVRDDVTVILLPDTRYYFVMSHTARLGPNLREARQDRIDSGGADGWSFPQRYRVNSGGGWRNGTNNRNLHIRVRGNAIPQPELDTATVSGNTLRLAYDVALDTGSVPAASDFEVMVGGATAAVSTVAISGMTVILILESSVTSGATVTVTYTVPGMNPIQDLASNVPAAALDMQSVTNNTPATSNTPPVGSLSPFIPEPFTAGMANTFDVFFNQFIDVGDTLTYSLGTVTGPSMNEITVDSTTGVVTIGASAMAGTYAIQVIATDTASQSATLTYAVTVNPALAPPALDNLVYEVNTAIDPPVTLPTATGGTAPISYDLLDVLPPGLTFSPNTRVLSGTPIRATPAVSLRYVATDANGSSISATFTVTVSADMTAPSLLTAAVSGDTLVLTYDEVLDESSVPATSAFTPGGTAVTVSAVAISGAKVTLTLSQAVTSTVTLTYAVGANPLQDVAGNDAAALMDESVASDTTAPTLNTAVVNGDTLTLTYNEALDEDSVPAASAFTPGGTAATVSTVAISGAMVTLTLSQAVTSTDVVTLTYMVPGTDPLQDAVGNNAAALTTQAVTNNTPPVPTGVMTSSAVAGVLAVSWTAPSPAPTGGYQVQYSSDGGSNWLPDPEQDVAADTTTHTFTGLAAGMYRARVRSVGDSPSNTSAWVETSGDPVQVAARSLTVRIDSDIRVNYEGSVNLGCTNPPTCDIFNLEALFEGVQDSTSGRQFELTDAPDHGVVGDGDGDVLSVGGTVDWEVAQRGDWVYVHSPEPTPASQNALTDSFQFDFESTTYTVNLVINYPPAVVGAPSMPGPFTVGVAENTFDVANDFTDRNGDTLIYVLGTVVGPVPTSVSSNGSVVTIDASVTAGEYTIPVTAMESEEDGGLSVTRNYTVMMNNPEIGITAVNASVTEGADAEFTVTASAAPANDLTVNVSVTDVGSFISGTAPTTVTILANMTSATLRISTDDDDVDENNGSLTCEVLPGSDYVVAMSPDDGATVTVNDNDGPGITVTPTSGLTTTEAGDQVTFTVVLDSQPTANVVIDVSSSDEGEGTVSPDMLTFMASDWSDPRTVTVTGVDDTVDDGNQAYMIELAAAVSTDMNYNNLDPDDVSVSNADNDGPPTSITLTVQPNTLSEGDNATDVTVTATFDGGTTVSTATTVMLSLGGTADSGTDYSATAPTITIAMGTSTGMATFNITPTDDAEVEGDENIEVSGTATGGFSGTVNSATVTLMDNDRDMEPPEFDGVAVNGDMLVLMYDEALDEGSVPDPGTFMIGGVMGVMVTNVEVSGMRVILTLSAAVTSEDVVTLTYAVPGTNPLQDAAGNDVIALSAQSVTNNTLSPPTALMASSDAAGALVVSWTAPSPAPTGGYDVQYSSDDGSNWEPDPEQDVLAGTTTHTFMDLAAGMYHARVRSVVGGVTSDWVETGTAVQVAVRTVSIDSEIRVNRNGNVPLGCNDFRNCTLFNLEVLFRGAQDSTGGLQFELTDAPDHGHVGDGDGGLLSVGESVDWASAQSGDWFYRHHDDAASQFSPSPLPTNADVDATTDSFQFTFEGTTYTVNLVIEQPPMVIGTPLTPGPFVEGTGGTFDVASDFTDLNGDTLTYVLGTVVGPVPNSVSSNGSVVTIDTSVTAGDYTIPVVASDDGGLSVTHEYMVEVVVIGDPPTGVTVASDAAGELEVSWTAPAPAPTGGYQVQYSSDGGSNWEPDPAQAVIADTTTHVFTDLAAGTYDARVRSVVGSDTSDWEETATAVQVDVRTVRIDSEISVNRNGSVRLGCTNPSTCDMFNLEVLFRGMRDTTAGLEFQLTDAPDHGYVSEASDGSVLEVGETTDWSDVRTGDWEYSHHDGFLGVSPPLGADEDAPTDSFEFSFEGTTYTVNLVIEQPPVVVNSPSMPGPFRQGTENTFNVASDFTDPNGDALTYALGTVTGPMPGAVMLGGSTVTIDMRAPAGTYGVPVTASEGALDVTYAYTIIINPTPGANTAPTVTPSTPGPYIAGTGGSFDVSADFSDSDGNTLMYALGTVSGPVAGAVRLRDSTVTVGTTATAGRYSIPVIATDNGRPPLSVSYTYQVVVDEPVLPSVSIAAGTSSVTEGTDVTFTVTATMVPSSDLTVNVSVTDSGSFISSSAPTTVMILMGTTSATLTVPTVGDSTDEPNGTLTATVQTGSGYTVAAPPDSSAEVTVNDNDAAPTSITLTVLPNSISEGDSATDVTVTATFDGGTTVSAVTTVTLSLGGTADSGTDYSATAPTITIAAEAATGMANFSITPTDDDVMEGDENIIVSGTAMGGFTGTVNSATVMLTDNDMADTMPLALTTPADLAYTVNRAIDPPVTLPTATGGTAPYTYTLTGPSDGPLPAGLRFDTTTRDLSGTPTTAGVTTLTYTATDANSSTVSVTFTVTVNEAVALTGPGPQVYTVGTAVNVILPEATGGTAPIRYTLLGVLPNGLTLNTLTRVLSGTPTMATAAAVNLIYGASDANGSSASVTFTVTVNVAPMAPSPPTGITTSSNAPGALTVSWTAPSPAPAGGYHVQYRLGSGAWMPPDPGEAVAMDATSYTFTSLGTAGMYTAQVRSVAADSSITSDWEEAASAAQVELYTVTIADDITVNRDGEVSLGCINAPSCTMFNLDIEYPAGTRATSVGSRFTQASTHGSVGDGGVDGLQVGESIPWSSAQAGGWFYVHNFDYATDTRPLSGGDPDALTDSFEFSLDDGTTHTVNIAINQPPAVVATPSTPEPVTAGTEATFDVTNDFSDPNGDTLTYALGTVAGPTTTAVSISDDGMVTIDTTAMAGTYTIPVEAEDDGGLSATHTYMVTVNALAPTAPSPPTAVMASSDAAGALAVSWTAPSPAPAGGYHVQYRLGSGAWMPADPGQAVAMDATSHTFTSLAAGMYHARVRSVGDSASNTSDWVETTGTAVQVDVRTVRIDSEIRVNRNDIVDLGCANSPTCTMFNLEVQFGGVRDTTSGLRFRLTDAPDHGYVTQASSGDVLEVGQTTGWSDARISGDWEYIHHDGFFGTPPPPGADVDALTDSFEFEFEGTIYRVNITVNQPPEVVASPSEPGPFTAGTAATFDVADDFTDPNGDVLTYALGTVSPTPPTDGVTISAGTVTISTAVPAGTYTIPVEAEDDGELSVTHEYVVVVSGSAPTGVTATANAAGRLAVSWTAPSPAPSDGYHVQHSNDGGANWLPDPEQDVAMDTTSHTFEDLAAGPYSTRVRAVYGADDASAWVQGTAVQVDVYELIIKDLEVERGANITLGCSLGGTTFGGYTYPNCIALGATLGIDLEFRGRPVSDTIANSLRARLIRAPAHGVISSEGDTIGMGDNIARLRNLRIGDASYRHRHADSPSDADPNAPTDSFDIELAGLQGTVPVTIFNRAPRIVDTPSQPGPYPEGTEETFDVSGDFTDATRETLEFSLGTVSPTPPTDEAVMLSGSTVTIGTAVTAGTYSIPVTASDGLLDTTYTYTVVVNPPPGGTNQAPTVVGTPSAGPFTAGTEATFDVSGDFSDPRLDPLSYALGTVTGPMPSAVTLMDSTVTIDTTATAGTYSIPVVAADNDTTPLSVTHVYRVVVEAANRAPVVVDVPSVPGPFLAGVEGTFDVSGDFRDPDGDPLGDPLTYSLGTVSPASAAVMLAMGTSVVTVGTGATAGDYTVQVTATDGGTPNLSVTHTYSVEVLATPEVSIRAVTVSVAEGTLATFQVVAEPPPSSALTVMLDVDDGAGDFIAGMAPTEVEVGTGGTSTFTVPTANDRVDEADGMITATVTSGSGYTVAVAPNNSATVTVTDDDDPEVSIAAGASVTEGGDATFTVTASSAPATSLFVNVSVDDGVGDFISGPAPQMVTIPAGGTSATLTVPTLDDSVNEADGMITATIAPGTGYTVAAPPAHRAAVAVSDDDTPEVSIAAVTSPVTEGEEAQFIVSASSVSASALTVNVSVMDSGSFLSGTAPTMVTIEAGQMSAFLRVATEDDSDDEPGGTLTVEVTTGSGYTVAAAPGNRAVVVVNDDDGTAEPSVTITADSTSVGEGTPATFTVEASSAAPTGGLTVNVSVTESGSFISGTPPPTVMISMGATTATLTVSTAGDSTDELDGTVTATVTSGMGYRVGTSSSATVTVTDDDDPVVSIAAGASPVGEGTSALFEVSASTVQASDLVVSVSVDDGTADFIAGTAPTTVTIPSGRSMVTLSVPTEEDRIDEADGPITATLTAGSGYTVAMSPDNSAMVTVTDNDVAGITVTPTSGLTTTEVGGTATFTVVLDSQPTEEVEIGVSSDTLSEGTVMPAMLTFTASDWNQPQPVTVTGVDDMNDDGTMTYTIELAAATSTDPNYSGVDPADVSVSNEDNDGAIEPTVTITAGGGVTEGTDATFTVAASPAPTSDLTVNVSVTESGSFLSGTLPTTVEIPANMTTATLTVSTQADSIDEMDGTITAELTPDTGGMGRYTVGMPSSAQVAVTDDDTAGITVTPTSGLTTTEAAGGTATFTVVLDSEPTASVSIRVSSSDTTEGTVSSTTLTFTSTSWDAAQTVTVTGVNDNVDDDDQAYMIELAAAVSTDPNYSGVDPTDVSVSNTDDDVAPTSITLTVLPNTLGEGDSATDVMVTATFDGGTTVLTATTVTLSLGGTATGSGTDYSTTTSTITIAAETATGTATLRITPTDDDMVEGAENIVVSGTATGGFSGTVNSATVTLTDNDMADAMPPTLSTATVNGNLLVLTYNEALDTTSMPAGGDFMIGGVTSVTVNTVAISGMAVTLTLSQAVTSTDVVTVSYTAPTTNQLQDVAGNDAADLTTQPVTNNTPAADTTPPTLSTATVNGNLLVLTYNEALDTTSMPAGGDFMIGGVTSVTVNAVAISGMAVTLTLSQAVTSTDVVTVSYTAPTTNQLQDVAGNDAADLTTQPVTNNTPATDTTPPTLSTATVNGNLLVLTYNEALDTTSMPAGGDFMIGGVTSVTVNTVAISGMAVTLTLSQAVTSTDVVTVSYTAPTTNQLQDVAGNDAADLTTRSVTNNTPATDTTPPTLSTATVNGNTLVLTYNEALDTTSMPAGGDFMIGGVTSVTVTTVAISGMMVTLTLSQAVTSGDTVTVTYTAPTTNQLQDVAGNDAADLTTRSVTNNTPATDTTPPTLSTATVNGSTLVLTYNEALDGGSVPAGGDFMIGGVTSVSVNTVAISGMMVTLTLSQAVTSGDTVTVTYTAPTTNRLQDVAGNAAANLTTQPVTNNTPATDTTPPTLSTATVNGNTLVLTYNEALDGGSVPAGGDFMIGGVTSVSVNTVAISGMMVTLTLSQAVTSGDTVTVTYTAPTTNRLQDVAGNAAANLTTQPVTNNTPAADTTPPTLSTATVNGNTLVLTYNEALDGGSVPAGGDFMIGGVTSVSVNTVAISGMMVTLTLSQAVTSGDTVTVTYTAPTTNRLQDVAGNDAADLTTRSVTNNTPATDTTPPTLSTATVNGNTLVLTYNEALDGGSVPAGGDFMIGGVTSVSVNTVAISGMMVTLTLSQAVTSGDTVTVGYTAPGTNPVQDVAGNDAADLTTRSVTNNTPAADTTPPTLSTATVNGNTLVLTYNEALDGGSVPAGGDFMIGGVTSVSVNTVAISGMMVTLTLSQAVTSGDTVTVDLHGAHHEPVAGRGGQ